MSIAYRAAASDAINGTVGVDNTLQVVIPATVQTGDCLLLAHTAGAAIKTAPDQGFLLEKAGISNASAYGYLYKKVAAAGDAGKTISLTTQAAKSDALLVAYSGTDPSTPVALSAVGAESISQTTHAAPELDPTAAGRLVEFLHLRDTSAAASTVWTPPTGTTSRASVNKAATSQVVTVAADGTAGAPAGAYSGNWTVDAASQNAVMIAVWLAPAAAGGTPQAVRPVSDVTTTGWTVTGGSGSFASAVDEPAADDADFVQSPNNPTGTAPLVLALGPASTPGALTGVTLSVRMQTVSATSSSVVVDVMQGTTVIASFTETGVTSAWQTFTYALTATQAGQVTDWTALRVRLKPTVA